VGLVACICDQEKFRTPLIFIKDTEIRGCQLTSSQTFSLFKNLILYGILGGGIEISNL